MNRLTQLFPLIAGAASMLALLEPRLFTWFGPLHIKVALALIMFFTGLSLTQLISNVSRVNRGRWQPVLFCSTP